MFGISSVFRQVVRSVLEPDFSEPERTEAGFGFQEFTKDFSQFDFKNIDLDAIQDGILHLSVPLKTGIYSFPGLQKKAIVQIKPDTMAWMTVNLEKNSKSETVISKISIKISPAMKIKNPSSAYQTPSFWNDLKDCFGRIFIDGIEINSAGEVLFQGIVKKGFLSEDIKEEFKPEFFPKIDLRLNALRKQQGGFSPTGSSETAVDLSQISIPDILKRFKLIMGEIKCSAKLRTNSPVESEFSLHAKANLKKTGELEIKPDEKFKSKAEFLGFQADLEGEATVSRWAVLKPKLKGRASATVPIHQKKPIVLDLKSKATVPVLVGNPFNYIRGEAEFVPGKAVKMSADALLELNIAEVEPIRVGPMRTKFKKASLRIQGNAKKQGNASNLQGDLKIEISEPQLSWADFHVAVPGTSSLEVKAKNLKQGTVSYQVQSENLRPFQRRLEYSLFPQKRLALKPLNTGMSEFLDPEHQFIWERDSISDPKTPPVGDFGSEQWRRHIERLSGASIRKNNKIKLLIDGKTSFPERIKLINNAKKFICLQSLIFKDDETGKATADALIAAHKRGVEVRVIIDSLGNLDSVKELIRGNKIYDYLLSSGIKLQLYSNSAVQSLREILSIVDENRVLKGLLTLRDLLDPKKTLSMFNLLARLARGTLSVGLSELEQEKIRKNLKIILGNNDEAEETVKRLATVSPENPLEAAEMLKIFHQVSFLNHRWHEKYLIIDGEEAILGGMNIADEYLKGGLETHILVAGHSRKAWRDTDILLQGEGAWDAYECFARNWETVTQEKLKYEREPTVLDSEQTVELQVIQSRPLQGIFHPITNVKIEAIKSLKSGDKIYEATPYLAPVGALKPYMEALILAAKRGVDVRLLTNSLKSTDMPQVNKAAMVSCYRDLLKAGVRIFERTGERTMHQKTAAYGSQLGLVGSFNLDNRSASLNSESLVVVHQEEFSKKIEQMLLRDMQEDVSQEIKFEDIEASVPMEELKNSAWAMLENLM